MVVTLPLSEQTTISQLVRTYGLTVSSILLPGEAGPGASEFLDSLSAGSGGGSWLVRGSPHPMDTFTSILEALMTILQGDNSFLVHRAEHFTTASNLSTAGSFRLEPAGRDTSFGIYVPDTEDHLVRAVQFQDELGQVYGPYSKMSTSYDLINYKTPNIALGRLPAFFAEEQTMGAGIRTRDRNPSQRTPSSRVWRYRIDWFEHRGDPVKSVIMVTSRNNKLGRLEY